MNTLTPPAGCVAHEVTFQCNSRTGEHRAKCTCGWIWYAVSLLECQLRASTHDIEWRDVDENEHST